MFQPEKISLRTLRSSLLSSFTLNNQFKNLLNIRYMSILAFQIPEKVVMEKADDFHGQFTFKPLEKGYGVTIGNALRRILLSSLEGYAITGVKIPSILHEFSTVEGV